jgi:hypothetical protein
MKKNLFLILIGSLFFEFSSIQAWLARVIPVSYDSNTRILSLLLSKNPKTGEWTDFGTPASVNNQPSKDLAQQILKSGTFWTYTEENAPIMESVSVEMPSRHERGKSDVFYFVPVSFLPMPTDSFLWIPETVIEKNKNVSFGVKDLFISHKGNPSIWSSNVRDQLVDASRKKELLPLSKEYGTYRTLYEFIIDKNTHQPTVEESLKITPNFERYVDLGLSDSFWIDYNDLKNEDGTPLTLQQKNEIKRYLENAEHHSDEKGFRLANNNYYVLATNPKSPYSNPVWKYVHRYLIDKIKNQTLRLK